MRKFAVSLPAARTRSPQLFLRSTTWSGSDGGSDGSAGSSFAYRSVRASWCNSVGWSTRPPSAGAAACAPPAQFDIPDDVTVVYFSNPFHGKPFATVVRALIASVDRNPRPLRIIYHNARDEDALLATGRVEVVATLSAVMKNPSRVYQVTPLPPESSSAMTTAGAERA